LLEVLVAVAIMSLTLFLAFTVNSRSIEAESRARARLRGIFAAESLMADELEKFPDIGKKSGKFEFGKQEYTYTLTVTEVPHPDAREVQLDLTYFDNGDAVSITLHGVSRK